MGFLPEVFRTDEHQVDVGVSGAGKQRNQDGTGLLGHANSCGLLWNTEDSTFNISGMI